MDESGGLVTVAEPGFGEEFFSMVERMKRGELTDCAQRALRQSDIVVIADPFSTYAAFSSGFYPRPAVETLVRSCLGTKSSISGWKPNSNQGE